MTNYEAIGRYHVTTKRARELISKRNDILSRVSLVIKNAIEQPQKGGQVIGKRCNFDALQNMLTEAKNVHDELMVLIEEINSLAPIAEEPEVKLD